jgi:hypothetical protein
MLETTKQVSMHCMNDRENELGEVHKHLMFNSNAIMAGFMLCFFTLASLYSGGSCSSAGKRILYHLDLEKRCDVLVGPT